MDIVGSEIQSKIHVLMYLNITEIICPMKTIKSGWNLPVKMWCVGNVFVRKKWQEGLRKIRYTILNSDLTGDVFFFFMEHLGVEYRFYLHLIEAAVSFTKR